MGGGARALGLASETAGTATCYKHSCGSGGRPNGKSPEKKAAIAAQKKHRASERKTEEQQTAARVKGIFDYVDKKMAASRQHVQKYCCAEGGTAAPTSETDTEIKNKGMKGFSVDLLALGRPDSLHPNFTLTIKTLRSPYFKNGARDIGE